MSTYDNIERSNHRLADMPNVTHLGVSLSTQCSTPGCRVSASLLLRWCAKAAFAVSANACAETTSSFQQPDGRNKTAEARNTALTCSDHSMLLLLLVLTPVQCLRPSLQMSCSRRPRQRMQTRAIAHLAPHGLAGPACWPQSTMRCRAPPEQNLRHVFLARPHHKTDGQSLQICDLELVSCMKRHAHSEHTICRSSATQLRTRRKLSASVTSNTRIAASARGHARGRRP